MFCCFTGHRPQNLPWGQNEDDGRCLLMKQILINIIEESIEDGFTDFYCGMALGADMYAAEAVLELIDKGENIRLHAAIPCPDQAKGWSHEERQRYESILSRCHSKILVNPFYSNSCMLTRNRFMVDSSDRVIAIWKGTFRGGTSYTIKYAKCLNKQILLINPKDLSVKRL